jgi:hypothetical protein
MKKVNETPPPTSTNKLGMEVPPVILGMREATVRGTVLQAHSYLKNN